MTAKVKTSIEGRLLIVELARPEKKNALTPQMYRTLNNTFATARDDERIRVLLFTGTKECFCAGNDLSNFQQQAQADEEDPGLEFVEHILNFNKPLVAAVNGPAIGLGATLLLHCDLVYASSGAYFQMPFVDLGICPEAGSTFLLPQEIGYARAASLLLLGERADAKQWSDLGLLTAMVESTDCREYAKAKAGELAKKPEAALAATRRLMRRFRGDCNDASRLETECLRSLLSDAGLGNK